MGRLGREQLVVLWGVKYTPLCALFVVPFRSCHGYCQLSWPWGYYVAYVDGIVRMVEVACAGSGSHLLSASLGGLTAALAQAEVEVEEVAVLELPSL